MKDDLYKKIIETVDYLNKANDMIYELGEVISKCNYDDEHMEYIKFMINNAEKELNDAIEDLDRLNVRDEGGNVFI